MKKLFFGAALLGSMFTFTGVNAANLQNSEIEEADCVCSISTLEDGEGNLISIRVNCECD